MSEGDRVSNANQGLNDEVVKLYLRGRRITGWAVNSVLLALLACVLSAVWALLSHFALPVTELQSIDVPESLLSRFSSTVVTLSGGGGLPFESVFGGIFSSVQGPVAFTVSIIGLAACGAAMIFGGDNGGMFGATIRAGLGISFMIASANIMTVFTDGATSNEKIPVSSREEFVSAVKNKEIGVVQQKLYSLLPLEDNSASDYVQAQLELLMNRKEPNQRLYERVSKAIDAKPSFTPNEKVAYLIDEAAFDEAKTEIARKYRDASLESAANRSSVAKTFFALAGIFVLIAFGCGWTARIMIKRVHRIDSDLDHKILDKKKKKPEPAAS